jgi:hypothetical protein
MGWKYLDLTTLGKISGTITLDEGIGEMENIFIIAGNDTTQPNPDEVTCFTWHPETMKSKLI